LSKTPQKKVNSKKARGQAKPTLSFEFKDDAVGTWLIASKPNGEQAVISLFARNERDQAIVKGLKDFGLA